MKIFLGADHRGFDLKNDILNYLQKRGLEVEDEGDKRLDPDDDFGEFAGRVVSKVLSTAGSDSRGILICGNGQGMCIAANRHKGIRAILGYDEESVRSSRNDDNSNVLCLPASTLRDETAYNLIDIWLNTPFSGAPRFVRRLNKIDEAL